MDRLEASASEDPGRQHRGAATAAVPRHSRAFTHGPSQARQAVPERAALHRFVQRQGHTFTDGQRAELRAWEARLCASPERAANAAQFAEFTALLKRHTDFLQSLRKPSLEACFEVHAVKMDQDLQFGKKFLRRSIPKLSQEQKDELAEWEAMLCDAGKGERLAFRPALQRELFLYRGARKSSRVFPELAEAFASDLPVSGCGRRYRIEPFTRRRLSLQFQPSLELKRLQEDAMAMTPLT